MINWGFVNGKTQTRFPWDSCAEGKPYRQAEIDQLRALTAAAQKFFDKTRARK